MLLQRHLPVVLMRRHLPVLLLLSCVCRFFMAKRAKRLGRAHRYKALQQSISADSAAAVADMTGGNQTDDMAYEVSGRRHTAHTHTAPASAVSVSVSVSVPASCV